MQIRLAQPADVGPLVTLINLAYRAEDFCIVGDRINAAGVEQMMSSGVFLVIDGESPDALLGCVYTSINGQRAYLGLLAVSPAGQGKGTSRLLIAAVEARARNAGCNFVDLTVINVRENLFGFYGKFGFSPFDTVIFPDPHKMRMPLHLVKLTKPLHPSPKLAPPVSS
jgi:GNAT superfamily N-acetyltransferase